MFPRAVDLTRVDRAGWRTQSAAHASEALGREGRERIVARLREVWR